MGDSTIPKQVLQSLGQIVVETGKEAIKQAGEITTGIITGQELLGINEISDEELKQKRMVEEQKKQKELAELRAQMGQGRNVEQEMKQVRQEDEQEEQQKIREEQEKERQQQAQMQSAPVLEPAGRQARGKMGGGHKKKQPLTQDQMTSTGEFKGKVD